MARRRSWRHLLDGLAIAFALAAVALFAAWDLSHLAVAWCAVSVLGAGVFALLRRYAHRDARRAVVANRPKSLTPAPWDWRQSGGPGRYCPGVRV